MKFEIKNRWSGNLIFSCETDNWKLAIELALKAEADLRSADLRSANLRSADLRYADLGYADLRYAKGISKYLASPLYILKDQVGAVRAYKLVDAEYKSPIHGTKLHYLIGSTHEVPDANTDENEDCGAGLHVATLDWCMREWQPTWRIILCEFQAEDLACIPLFTPGKFRVRKLTVIRELDLKEIGLIKDEEPKAEAA